MFVKFSLIVVVCAVCVAAEAPLRGANYHYRGQRLRQQPFARQQQAAGPYAPAGTQPNVPFNLPAPNPNPKYGAPPAPTTQPPTEYGPPPSGGDGNDGPTSNETTDNPDSETVAHAQAGRFQQFEKLRQAPRGGARHQQPQQFQRLRTQSSQLPRAQQLLPLAVPAPVFRSVAVQQPVLAPLVAPHHSLLPHTDVFQRLELQPIQPEGSYYIQLPSGSIQRVNYIAQPAIVDDQFRQVAEAEATTIAEQPQIYVNTLVQAYTNGNGNNNQ